MEKSEEKFCRLCLITITNENYQNIEGNTREVFDFLLPSLSLAEGNKQILCDGCSSKLFEAYNFKAICLETEDTLSPYLNSNKTLMYGLKEIYIMEKGEKGVNPWLKDQKVCRLCLHLISYKFIRLEDDTKVGEFIPEVKNFKVIADPVICQKCYDSLFTYSNFIKQCLDNEMQKNSIPTEIHIKTEEIDIKLEEKETFVNTQCISIKSEEVEQIDIKLEEETFVSPEFVAIKSEEPEQSSSEQMYQCANCTYMTNYKPYLRRHVLVHRDKSEVRTFRCNECNYQSKWKRDLRIHLKKHKNPSQARTYKCTECEFVTLHRNSLKVHELNHKDLSEIPMYKCGTCEFQTKHKQNILKHQFQHMARMDTCHKCGAEEELKERRKNASEAFECKKCMNEAEVVASGLQMYKCDKCDFETLNEGGLSTHPCKVQIYSCDKCSFQTKVRKCLRVHSLRHKDPSEVRTYKCDKCTYVTRDKYYLETHQVKHKDASEIQTWYKCDKCELQFKWKTSLKNHTLTHKDFSEVQMYKCDVCRFVTKYKYSFKIHHLKHGKKVFPHFTLGY